MEDVFQLLMLVGGLTGIGVGAVWAVAGAVVRMRGRRPTDQPELARMGDRLSRLEQAVEAVAVEVERVGEGQRFVTRLLADRQPLPETETPGRLGR